MNRPPTKKPDDALISPADFPIGSLESRAAARLRADQLDRSAIRLSVSCVCHAEAARFAPFDRIKGGLAFRMVACPFDEAPK